METKEDSKALKDEAVRKLRMRQLWEVSSERHRPETGHLNFTKWLQEHFPNLIPPGEGDPCQRVRAELIQQDETE